MFNGLIPTNPNEYEVLMNASTALNVTRIEYYRFDYAETPYYDSALNFVLNLTINVPDISDPDWGYNFFRPVFTLYSSQTPQL